MCSQVPIETDESYPDKPVYPVLYPGTVILTKISVKMQFSLAAGGTSEKNVLTSRFNLWPINLLVIYLTFQDEDFFEIPDTIHGHTMSAMVNYNDRPIVLGKGLTVRLHKKKNQGSDGVRTRDLSRVKRTWSPLHYGTTIKIRVLIKVILAGQGVYSPYINFNEYFNGLDWVEFIPLPINVRYHSAVTWRKHIWVFGGFYYRKILSNYNPNDHMDSQKMGSSEFIRLMTFAKVMMQQFKSREFLSISKSVFKIQKMAVRKTF